MQQVNMEVMLALLRKSKQRVQKAFEAVLEGLEDQAELHAKET